MEQKTNKSKLKIIIPIAIVILAVIGIVIKMFLFKSSSSKAVVTFYNGETVEMSAQDIINIYNENQAIFEKKYLYAKIQFEGTVEQIKTKTDAMTYDHERWLHGEPQVYKSNTSYMTFKEGWALSFDYPQVEFDLTNFKKGDKVKVTTHIIGVGKKNILKGNVVVWSVGYNKYYFYTEDTIDKAIIEKK